MTTESNPAAFGETDLVSLGEKLASLQLTNPERAALSELLSDDDVAGFGEFNLIAGIRVGLRANTAKIDGFGIRADGYGVRADMIKPGDFGGGDAMKPGRF